MLKTIKDIFSIYTPQERRNFSIIVFLMFVTALMEMLSIGAVLPFINIIQNPEILNNNQMIIQINQFFGLSNNNQLLILLLMLFVVLIVVKNLFNIFLTYIYLRFSLNKQARLATQLFSAYLRMDYIQHKKQNSAVLVRNVTTETLHVLKSAILPITMVISEGLIIFCILGFIFFINPTVAISIAGYGILLGGMFVYLLKPTMNKLSTKIQYGLGEMLRYSQESFVGVKDIIISNSYDYHISKFQNFANVYARAGIFSLAFNAVPRAMFEITFMLIFASTIIILIFSNELSEGLPLLGVYAVAAFRLIPSLNRCSSALNQLNVGCASLNTIKEDLQRYKIKGLADSSALRPSKLQVKKSIDLSDVSFAFNDVKIINKLNLSITKGKMHALTGKSGSGKTTLVDIIIGLLKPASGKITLDGKEINALGRKYVDMISYVPQEIHIADDTVRANIAYGLSKVEANDKQIWQALEAANIADVIKAMPKGLDTLLDEKGSRLSGGQKQRIGIARALYSKPSFLIMDEPTAALDKTSEKQLLKTLNKLKKSMIILLVTHSPEVIKASDVELKLLNGKIK